MALILITGASRGIGLELACQYAEAGEQVIATCRDPETAKALAHLAQSHGTIEVQKLDVVDPLSILSLASLVSKRDGAVDMLINNAGILVAEDVGEWSADSFTATLETNVVGPAMIMQAFAKAMSPGGKMVNISSGLGSFELGMTFGTTAGTYAASKAALNMTVRQIAPYLREKAITAVSFSPGWVRTDMGGQEATLSPEESVKALRKAFAEIKAEDAGRFFDCDGKPLPW